MDCPRCKLVNPPNAKRCDCGYDFETQKVEASYSRQALPKDIRTSLVVIIVLNLVLGFFALSARDPSRILGVVVWSVFVYFCYSRLLKRQNWARIALAVLTFPIGTVLFLSAEVRLYCLQAGESK